ncbi:MAG: CoA ester lyase [Rhodobacteraceae bacterium]|nr:CoA ester lyase [Paracoccaceae bacterium]
MDPLNKPFRSLLYIPGSKERALEKATTLAADGIIFDLEDAVAPDEKANARELVAATLRTRDYGQRSLMVRINGFDTDWAMDDLEVILNTGPQAILLPKVGSAADIQRLAAILDHHANCADTAIWAMMESPLGILNAKEIAAASPRIRGMVLGTNDLVKDLGARQTDDRLAVTTSLGLCLLAARAYGLVCVDGVYNKYQDTEMLRQMCEQGRDMGFDGKTLIHPAQIAIANQVFAPSAADLDLAARQIEAFAAAKAKGLGIAVLDGNIVENLHVESARRLLARQDAIAVIEAGAN